MAADITAFPAIQDVLVSGDNIREFTATEEITQGQVVGFAATGIANAVVPMDATVGENAIGVALYSAAAAAKVKVAMAGCQVKVANYHDTTVIEAGEYVQQDDNTVKGTVGVFTPRADLAEHTIAAGDFIADGSALLVGISQTAIAADGTGIILILPSIMLYTDARAQ